MEVPREIHTDNSNDTAPTYVSMEYHESGTEVELNIRTKVVTQKRIISLPWKKQKQKQNLTHNREYGAKIIARNSSPIFSSSPESDCRPSNKNISEEFGFHKSSRRRIDAPALYSFDDHEMRHHQNDQMRHHQNDHERNDGILRRKQITGSKFRAISVNNCFTPSNDAEGRKETIMEASICETKLFVQPENYNSSRNCGTSDCDAAIEIDITHLSHPKFKRKKRFFGAFLDFHSMKKQDDYSGPLYGAKILNDDSVSSRLLPLSTLSNDNSRIDDDCRHLSFAENSLDFSCIQDCRVPQRNAKSNTSKITDEKRSKRPFHLSRKISGITAKLLKTKNPQNNKHSNFFLCTNSSLGSYTSLEPCLQPLHSDIVGRGSNFDVELILDVKERTTRRKKGMRMISIIPFGKEYLTKILLSEINASAECDTNTISTWLPDETQQLHCSSNLSLPFLSENSPPVAPQNELPYFSDSNDEIDMFSTEIELDEYFIEQADNLKKRRFWISRNKQQTAKSASVVQYGAKILDNTDTSYMKSDNSGQLRNLDAFKLAIEETSPTQITNKSNNFVCDSKPREDSKIFLTESSIKRRNGVIFKSGNYDTDQNVATNIKNEEIQPCMSAGSECASKMRAKCTEKGIFASRTKGNNRNDMGLVDLNDGCSSFRTIKRVVDVKNAKRLDSIRKRRSETVSLPKVGNRSWGLLLYTQRSLPSWDEREEQKSFDDLECNDKVCISAPDDHCTFLNCGSPSYDFKNEVEYNPFSNENSKPHRAVIFNKGNYGDISNQRHVVTDGKRSKDTDKLHQSEHDSLDSACNKAVDEYFLKNDGSDSQGTDCLRTKAAHGDDFSCIEKLVCTSHEEYQISNNSKNPFDDDQLDFTCNKVIENFSLKNDISDYQTTDSLRAV